MNWALIILIIILIAFVVATIICLIKKDLFENNDNDKTNIVLITEYFVHKNTVRFNEIKTSIDKNDKNKYIDRIYLLNEKEDDKYYSSIDSGKIVNIPMNKRGTFEDTFKIANYLPDGTIVVISNNDISFDESLKTLLDINLDNTVICLGRRSAHDGKKLEYWAERGLSQDSWIFKTPIKIPEGTDFHFGTNACDHHIAYLLNSIGYKLINIPWDIKAYHNHISEERKWLPVRPEWKKKYLSVMPTTINDEVNICMLSKDLNTNYPKCNLNTLWCQSTNVELNYLNEIFDNNIKLRTFNNLLKSNVKKINILIYNSENYSISKIQKLVNKFNIKILVILSDEFIKKEEHLKIQNVNLILRNYFYDKKYNNDKIFQFPIGYHCWDSEKLPYLNSIYRKYIWSFIGSAKGEREKQLNELKQKIPNYFCDKTPKENNKYIYQNSKFVISLRGNVRLECFRIYSALRNGCIVIVLAEEQEFNKEFEGFSKYCSEIPLLYANTIDGIVLKINKVLNNEKLLNELSLKSINWYNENIKCIQNLVRNAIK